MLDGSFTVKVDEKGRVKIPSDFRKLIQDRFGNGDFYVTSVQGDCARLYPAHVWQGVLERINAEPPSRPAVRKFRRGTSYYGQRASVDPQGRLLIHPRLRNDASLDEEVVVIGQRDYLEVWNHKKFKETMQADPMKPEEEDYLASRGL